MERAISCFAESSQLAVSERLKPEKDEEPVNAPKFWHSKMSTDTCAFLLGSKTEPDPVEHIPTDLPPHLNDAQERAVEVALNSKLSVIKVMISISYVRTYVLCVV